MIEFLTGIFKAYYFLFQILLKRLHMTTQEFALSVLIGTIAVTTLIRFFEKRAARAKERELYLRKNPTFAANVKK